MMAEKEYIEKSPLIRDLTAMKSAYEAISLDGMIKALQEAPAADLVEVVRCKDCKHFYPYEEEEHKGNCDELVGLESCVYQDDFCSYGERKVSTP